jgi:hypothetical protein
LFLIYLVAYIHGLQNGGSSNPPNSNALLAKHLKDVTPNKEIAINPTTSLCGFSRAKLYALRTKMVLQHPELVLGTYKPSQAVFGQIVDGKPWWGITGQFFYGSGKYSPTGDSEESRFILNPFLLASPEFFGLTFYNGGKFRWRDDITQKLLDDDHFPFYCLPHNLKWAPEAASAEVTYDVSSYMKWLNKINTQISKTIMVI